MLSPSKRRARYRRAEQLRSRRSKVAALLAGIAIVASGTIIACSDSPVAPEASPHPFAAKEARALGPLTIASAGSYHNAFLDFSFPKVRSAIRAGSDHKRACKVIAQAMREFVVEHRIGVDPRSIGDEIAGARCGGASGRKADPAGRFTLAGDGTTSVEFDAVVQEMGYAVGAGYSPTDLSALFDQKVAYALANFPAEEAEVIAAAASVGLSSVEYWNANYETQFVQLQEAMQPVAYNRLPVNEYALPGNRGARILVAPPADIRAWRAAAARIGIADLKGAVHGGITGSRGGWQGAAAGAAIEGGARSAGALLNELFK